MDTAGALRICDYDPAKRARIHREAAQRALIFGEWGRAEGHRAIALEWEEVYEAARAAGMRLDGESAGVRT